MIKKCSMLLVMLSPLIFSSCESVPDGIAPDGSLVSFTPSNATPVSPNRAIDMMTTSLLTSGLLYIDGKPAKVMVKAPIKRGSSKDQYFDSNISLPVKVFKQLLQSGMAESVIREQDANYIIASQIGRSGVRDENGDKVLEWRLSMYKPTETDQQLWSYAVNIREEK